MFLFCNAPMSQRLILLAYCIRSSVRPYELTFLAYLLKGKDTNENDILLYMYISTCMLHNI